MATVVYNDADIEWDSGGGMQAQVKSLTINYNAESLDETAMGNDTRIHKGGLKDWSVEVEFHQDFGGVDEPDLQLWGEVGKQALLIATVDGGENYQGQAMLESYSPASGSVGDLLPATATFVSAGTLTH
jgi:hypothetical protein